MSSKININVSNEMPLKTYDLADNGIVRFNNRLYRLKVPKYGGDILFCDYHVAKIVPIHLNYDFRVRTEKGIYDDGRHHDLDFQHTQYDRVLKEGRLVAEADADKEYMDCLQTIYTQSAMCILSRDEVAARERIHETRLRDFINGEFAAIAKYIWKMVQKSNNALTYRLKLTEDTLTSWGKYPIYFKVPNMDNELRGTFVDYAQYIFKKVYPAGGRAIAEDIIDNQTLIGHTLVAHVSALFPTHRVDYILVPGAALPAIRITLGFLDRRLLL